MRQIESSAELKKYYNYLFFDINKRPLKAQLWLTLWTKRSSPELTAKLGAHIPPALVGANDPIPLTSSYAPEVDIEVNFSVDGPLFFTVKNVKLSTGRIPIGVLFMKAIQDLGGNFDLPNSTKGYITHMFARQKQATIYEVEQIGDMFTVKKSLGGGNFQDMNVTSSRMKTIINLFKAQVLAGTLQTTLAN